MKKLFIIFTILVSSFTQAQQEIKLDILDILVVKTLEISYENYLNNDSSVGVSILFNFGKKRDGIRYLEDKMITPYFRHYFSSNLKWNYFGEAFLGLNFGEKKIHQTNKSYTDAALGVAVGIKYISKDALTIDFHIGVGRNLFSSFSPVLVPRIGANIGYRF